jgi:ABC-type multidrug transport system permease subunit
VDLGVRLLKDPTQGSAAAIIEQVVQVTMLRVTLPFMIGQAFQKLTEPRFIDRLGEEVRLPMPEDFPVLVDTAEQLLKDRRVRAARFLDRKLDATLKKMEGKLKEFGPLAKRDRVQLAELIRLASGNDPKKAAGFRRSVGDGVQKALERQFSKYNLIGMTWAALTKSRALTLHESAAGTVGLSASPAGMGPLLAASALYPGSIRSSPGAVVSDYRDLSGSGLLRRGAHRYQVLVPSYTVMFAFFLVLTVGWVFVAERRQGTLLRLRAAPLTRGHVLLGKLLPCFVVSLGQGVFLLVAGRLLFGMRWGPDGWSLGQQAGWLFLVVFCTSLAAMGLALLVASVARSEAQVAIYGALPVLVLALIGGCVLPREMMPEQTQKLSLLTPQGWALDAYRELLNATAGYEPNLAIVTRACLVLAAFGAGFLALAWGLLRLD